MLDQARKDAAFAKLKHMTRGPSWSIPDLRTGIPSTHNPIREKAQAYQAKRKLISRPSYRKTPRPARHNENQIHDLIVDHPFLLFTPRLYEGGLFLESIISKLPICRQPTWAKKDSRVPDFIILLFALYGLTTGGAARALSGFSERGSACTLSTRYCGKSSFQSKDLGLRICLGSGNGIAMVNFIKYY